MNQPQKDTKIYVTIVNQLRLMIEKEGLKSGDKLPSERELSERLNVGRSSVREALRALELLGLIETRRGEGTFIRNFEGHQLVHLLSTFILQDEKSKRDIMETKYLIEFDCLWLILQKATDEQLVTFQTWSETATYKDDDYFLKVIRMADNHLFLRIWTILKDYYNSLRFENEEPTKQEYLKLSRALLMREEIEVRKAFRELRKMSNE